MSAVVFHGLVGAAVGRGAASGDSVFRRAWEPLFSWSLLASGREYGRVRSSFGSSYRAYEIGAARVGRACLREFLWRDFYPARNGARQNLRELDSLTGVL